MNLDELAQLSDKELVRRSARGDEDAFGVLFERKHRRVFLTAYQLLGDQGVAEDVVQEAFLALWRHCGRYRAKFSLDTWLARIATNKAIDRYRTEQRHPRVAGPAREDGPPTTAQHGAEGTGVVARRHADDDPTHRARWREVQELWESIAGCLSAQQRAAFVLREIEQRPTREVAHLMGCRTSTVRSHLALARKALRAALEARS